MRLQLPQRDFGAYLFDCDGTIVDSMPLHFVAWRKLLGAYGCDFEEETFYSLGGMPTREIVARLNVQQGLRMPVEEVCTRKERLYMEMLPELKPVPEVLEHIEAQYGKIPFAVVSGSTRDSVEASLRTLKLLERFETLVCAGEYKKGKPDPEPFLLAASRLGVAARDCLVFEDTEMGVASATAAGMGWVRVPSPRERQAAYAKIAPE
jgi:HAD superfamily hydrolase (TIGR01509 family)